MRDNDSAHLRSFLQPAAQAEDDESGLPSLPAGDYKPYSSPSNKPVFAIHFIRPAAEIRSFQYMDLDSDSRYEPGLIRLRFTGTTVLEVVIRGRNLWMLYDRIHRHVIRWVMIAPRDFAKDGDGIVTGIDIREVKPDRREQADAVEETESA